MACKRWWATEKPNIRAGHHGLQPLADNRKISKNVIYTLHFL
jgi:hypothetical protein